LNSTTLLTMMTDVMKTGKTKKTAHLRAHQLTNKVALLSWVL